MQIQVLVHPPASPLSTANLATGPGVPPEISPASQVDQVGPSEVPGICKMGAWYQYRFLCPDIPKTAYLPPDVTRDFLVDFRNSDNSRIGSRLSRQFLAPEKSSGVTLAKLSRLKTHVPFETYSRGLLLSASRDLGTRVVASPAGERALKNCQIDQPRKPSGSCPAIPGAPGRSPGGGRGGSGR